ncbi:squalene synthase HpnC [Oxalobacteraceae bacterium OM1]|nr:squalene synthase HpnC [Oxalobacteraceae bacterium OM1]
MPVEHYENFPVASLLLPARLRPAVEAIYAFARSADDIADEGDAPAAQRLAALAAYERELDGIAASRQPELPLFRRLAEVIAQYGLPMQPMRDLLSAFAQDVVTTRYATFDDLRDYCRRSADPIGRLMLHLYGAVTPDNVADADRICTALQLINFWQDVAVDWRKARIYLPAEDLRAFGVAETDIAAGTVDANWRRLLQFQAERARSMMLTGAPLALRLPGRLGWELRLVVQGGLRILERIEQAEYDVFRRRPVLGPRDWLVMAGRALTMRFRLSRVAQVG